MAKRNSTIGRIDKPYTVLTRVQAKSGAWEYEIRISHETGVTYCTCRGWGFRKTCAHLDAYLADPVFVPGTVPTAPQTDLASRTHEPRAPRVDALASTVATIIQQEMRTRGYVVPLGDSRHMLEIAQRVIREIDSARPRKASGAAPIALPRSEDVALNAAGVRVIILPD